MAKKTRHTDRTYRLLESWGWDDWWSVEVFNGFSGKKTDLYHIIDCLVLTRKGVVGVQICGPDYAPHVKKILIDEQVNTKKWLSTPGTRLFLIGWRKLKSKVQRRTKDGKEFYPRIAQITLDKKGDLNLKEFPLNEGKTWTSGKF